MFLGSTSACAIYSYQMAQALLQRSDCELNIFISKRVYNLEEWRALSITGKCTLSEIDTYRHNVIEAGLSYINIPKIYGLSRKILASKPDVVYFPFGCVWGPVLYPMLHKRVPVINTIHDPHLHDKYRNLAEMLFFKSGEWSQRFISGFIILNDKDRDYIHQKYNRPVGVIPHAAFNYYAGKAKSDISRIIRKKISFIGRIEPYKGVDLLIDAFEKLKISELKLLVAGGGELEFGLKSRILNNKNIELRNNFIPDNEMIDIVRESDFVVLPYKRASQSGVIPMCFALGRTVVSTNVGSLSQQVPEGTGIIVEPDADAIASAIERFYSNEQDIFSYSDNAKKYADTELSWSRSVELLMQFANVIKR